MSLAEHQPICKAVADDSARGRGVEWENRYAAQENLKTSLPYRRERRIPVEPSLQLCEAQGGQQHLAVMLSQLPEDGVRTIAGMDRDVCVDKVGHYFVAASLLAYGHFDRYSFLNAPRLWHTPQCRNYILQAVARGKDRNDITEARDFQINVRIGVGQLGRNPYRLAIAGFEDTGSWHRSFCPSINAAQLRGLSAALAACQSSYIRP
jgi:hypothetical protein